jgi:hypothetical protein
VRRHVLGDGGLWYPNVPTDLHEADPPLRDEAPHEAATGVEHLTRLVDREKPLLHVHHRLPPSPPSHIEIELPAASAKDDVLG